MDSAISSRTSKLESRQMFNPYNAQQSKPILFCGRKNLTEDIITRILRENISFGIFAGSKMGKTTLLRHIEKILLYLTPKEVRGGILLLPIYVNFQDLPMSTSAGEVYQLIGDLLRERFEGETSLYLYRKGAKGTIGDYQDFKEYLQFIVTTENAYRVRIIFLLDDIHFVTTTEWSLDFFANWNALLTKVPNVRSSISAIFAGTSELYRLTKDVSSPLSNTLKWRELTSFSHSETIELMQKSSAYAWSDAMISEVYNITGGHPFLLQYIMESICNQADVASKYTVKSATLKCLKANELLFKGWWDNFDDKIRSIYTYLIY